MAIIQTRQWVYQGSLRQSAQDEYTTVWRALNTQDENNYIWGAIYSANNASQKLTDQLLDENNQPTLLNAKLWQREIVSLNVSTPLQFLTAKNSNDFDAPFVWSLIEQIASTLRAAPYNISNNDLLNAMLNRWPNVDTTFDYTRNYANMALNVIRDTLNAKQFKGDEWYNSAAAQSMKQQGAADALVREHAYDGKDLMISLMQQNDCPFIDKLVPRWISVCIAANISLRDLSEGTQYYFSYITNPSGNAQWWAIEAWFRIPLQGYGATHPEFNWPQYINYTLELSQQKQLGDQLMAAQRGNGGDDWALIGFVVSIGVMIATGGAGILGLIADSISTSSAALSAADAIIATENAIDVASVLADASATVAAETQAVAIANQAATSLANDAINAWNATSQAVTNVANTIPLSDTAAQTFYDATQTLTTNANDIVNVTQEAQNILDNHAQVIQDAIDNVQNNTIPASDTGLPTNPNASMPDWTSGYDVPSQNVSPPRVPVTTSNIQSIADQIGKAIANISPSQAMSIATTAFKLVSGTGGQTGKPAVYAKQPGAPSTYDQFLQYYNSLTPENNYGIKGNISPLIAQIGVPVLILVGALALSKGKAK